MRNPIDISTHRARMEFLIAAALTRRGQSRPLVVAFLLSHQVTPETFITDPAKAIARIIDKSIRNGYTVKREIEELEKILSPAVLSCVRDFTPRTKREAKQIGIAFCQMLDSEGVRK